jgi:hypothetical protein
MHSHPLTVTTPRTALARLSATEVARQLQGRCSGRVCYTQTSTPTGERVYGHFSMEAEALADALGRQIFPRELTDAPTAELTLHRWLRDHDEAEESDDPPVRLSAAWPGLEHGVEELVSNQNSRAFCTCCNRNLAPREIRLERSTRQSDGVHYRYLCPGNHLLLEIAPAQIVAAVESRAA